jgi:sterol 24-C-methyltransferase
MSQSISTTSVGARRGADEGNIDVLGAARTGLSAEKVKQTVRAYRELHAEGEEGDLEARKRGYAKMVNDYYDLVTDFYQYGWGQSFHFAPRFAGESFEASIARHQHWLSARLGLRPGMRALDVGCGVGGPLRSIARFSGASVVGINNNDYQIKKGRALNIEARLADRCELVKGDFMELPFEDDSFDAVYQIEATAHAPDKAVVYSEIRRVLKPGGAFGSYEWCMTEAYDPASRRHNELKKGVEEGDALPDIASFQEVDDALVAAGLVIEEREDRAQRSDPEAPWYLPLTGRERSLRGLSRSSFGRELTHVMVQALERLKVAPEGATEVSALLNLAADALVGAGELGIFTPMYFTLARKPG